VGTVAAAQMGSEGSMAFTQRYASRGIIGRSMDGEVGALENEQHGSAIVAAKRGEMKRCALLVIPCIDRCACFHQYSADFSMSLLCSHMEGCALPVILCLNHCSCFHEHATGFIMPILCSKVEGRELMDSLCPDRCSSFDEHSADFSMSL
jgi:hypothetical protein